MTSRHSRTLLLTCALMLPLMAAAADIRILGVQEPPGSFASENGTPRGISVDYVREIQKRVGNSDPILIVPETEALAAARLQPNVVAFSFSRTNEREDQFHWIAHVFRKPWVLYVRKDSALKVASIEDMRKATSIGVTEGDVRALWLQKQEFSNLVPVAEPEQNIANLLAGKVEAIFFEPQGVAFYCRKLRCPKGELVNIYSPRSSEVYILMSRGTPEATVRKWKDAAAQIRTDGTFAKMAEKWVLKSALDYGIDSTVRDGVLIFR